MRTSPGKLVCDGAPRYPSEALKAHLKGHSAIQVHLAKDGRVDDTRLARSGGPSLLLAQLDSAALAAARQRCHAQVQAPGESSPQGRWVLLDWRWAIETFEESDLPGTPTLAQLRERADAGDALASWQFYQRMQLEGQTSDAILQRLKVAAQGGVAEAQFELGRQYLAAVFVTPDHVLAKAWWERARRAEGDTGVRATIGLARLLLAKDESARDPQRALVMLQRAAEDPHADDAMLILGDTYHAGQDVPRDEGVAQMWWRRAGRAGAAMGASLRLGDAYRDGAGVASDRTRAAAYYLYAQDHGSAAASARLTAMDAGSAALLEADALRQGWGESNAPWQAD